jgi:hypothetical protein
MPINAGLQNELVLKFTHIGGSKKQHFPSYLLFLGKPLSLIVSWDMAKM